LSHHVSLDFGSSGRDTGLFGKRDNGSKVGIQMCEVTGCMLKIVQGVADVLERVFEVFFRMACSIIAAALGSLARKV
jgi:hypothetical protein